MRRSRYPFEDDNWAREERRRDPTPEEREYMATMGIGQPREGWYDAPDRGRWEARARRAFYDVYTLGWSEETGRNEWRHVTRLSGLEWGGSPRQVLTDWFEETRPAPGTYRCQGRRGAAVVLHWKGGADR